MLHIHKDTLVSSFTCKLVDIVMAMVVNIILFLKEHRTYDSYCSMHIESTCLVSASAYPQLSVQSHVPKLIVLYIHAV